jgi:hypothetical protein
MDTNRITCVPWNCYVAFFRMQGNEVRVFAKSGRHIVVIKLRCPYGGEAVYDAYDSELENKKLFCPKT